MWLSHGTVSLCAIASNVCCAVVCTGMGMERALFIREHNDGLYRPIIYLVRSQ
jgi:hypothetical protein